MSKMIQVRNVPDKLHRELTRRARANGQTLTAYVQHVLEREVSTPPLAEVLERIRRRPGVQLREGEAAGWIREARDERDVTLAAHVRRTKRRAS